MFYETAQTVGPGWHGKSFKPSHYDDLSWSNPSSTSRHFRSPGSSPTFRRRIITHDNDDDDAEPHMFHRRSPTFERKFFKDVWDDRPAREDIFEDRPRMFKRNWDKDPEDFESSLRRDKDFRNEFDHHQDDDDDYEARVHHIPIMVERLREKMNDAKSSYRNRCPSPPPPSMEQQNFVDESDEWLQHHMNRLKQNFDSGFSTMQNRRHRLPRVDLNSRPRAFTSPIPDWGPESVHTLPSRKLHGRIFSDEKRNPKSVFRSYSETHEDIPREHPTAARSHSDSHCPKTTYVTKVSVNMPPENCEKPSEEVDDHPPEPPQRRSRYRQRKQENAEQEQNVEQPQEKQNDEPNTQQDQGDSKPDCKDTPTPCDSKARRGSKDGRGANALLQISSVLQNVEDLLHHVEAYTGNGSDKQFRFLDEMLTRCMLRLDDVDTDGLEDVRSARKAAVRQVQACIEKLESRATLKGKKNDPSEGPENDKSQPEDTPREEEPAELEITSDTASSKEVEQTRL